ncbi:MAG TPA: quinoprotein dehydrogenase-associated SoxYZ-like carrier, partial [Acetobacteraceae bacterium]|nr:quinoprotein dehydrogenase-associated SoxYZ-like carrier [Acetobacteraceae bacterium]
ADDDAARAARWHDLAKLIFDGRQPVDQAGWLTIDAPVRAMDAALVPVTIGLAPDKKIKGLYLVVDENPSPVAAHIEFGPESDTHTLTLRVRVDQYTNLHAVAETADGRLISTARFIKAAGGCSAPGSEAPELALKEAGQMKLRVHGERAELLIRHPNFNGMQMDQVTRLYTPARYIDSITVAYEGQRVLHMDTDISLASDPAIGFGFKSDGTGTLTVDVADTSHATWHRDFPLTPHGS